MPIVEDNLELENPYPLARNFYLRLLPALIVFFVALTVLIGFLVRQSAEDIYLVRATHTAENIARDVSQKNPVIWDVLLKGGKLSELQKKALINTFRQEYLEYRLVGLKVYDHKGLTLYSHDIEDIGKIEKGSALRAVVIDHQASAIRKVQSDGTEVFELYVPYLKQGQLAAIFELYEASDGAFQTAMRTMVLPVVITLFLLSVIFVLLFIPVVRGAQAAIVERTAAVVDMRTRLARLLSRGAVETMRNANKDDLRKGKRIELTILYSDIRGFTRYCENREPEQIIEVLNKIIDIQILAIESQGGDVDKIIGDAVLALFEGEGREQRAVRAAQMIQKNLAEANLPLKVGIGIFSGPVVSGVLGTGTRTDYTVIGDSVNIASRLCSAASEQEVVCDKNTVRVSQTDGFEKAEKLFMKGRDQPISVRSWRL